MRRHRRRRAGSCRCARHSFSRRGQGRYYSNASAKAAPIITRISPLENRPLQRHFRRRQRRRARGGQAEHGSRH
ncbi:hypothetical protein M8494_20015 [Serratia ureilytica]